MIALREAEDVECYEQRLSAKGMPVNEGETAYREMASMIGDIFTRYEVTMERLRLLKAKRRGDLYPIRHAAGNSGN